MAESEGGGAGCMEGGREEEEGRRCTLWLLLRECCVFKRPSRPSALPTPPLPPTPPPTPKPQPPTPNIHGVCAAQGTEKLLAAPS